MNVVVLVLLKVHVHIDLFYYSFVAPKHTLSSVSCSQVLWMNIFEYSCVFGVIFFGGIQGCAQLFNHERKRVNRRLFSFCIKLEGGHWEVNHKYHHAICHNQLWKELAPIL